MTARPWSVRALVAIALLAAGPPAAAQQCRDPCLQSARATYKQCNSSATGAFVEALDGCLERDHTCVNSCRWTRRECNGATGLAPALVACDAKQDVALDECSRRFPLAVLKRVRCIYRAQRDGARCHAAARRSFRDELKSCQQAFEQCAATCGGGAPPDGAGACKASAKAASRAVLADCKQVLQVNSAACFNKEASCVQDCGTARGTCNGPTQAVLAQALAVCATQVQAAVNACVVANPGGGSALDACVQAAQADGTACADDAAAAAAPGIAACVPPYVGCVRSCPKA